MAALSTIAAVGAGLLASKLMKPKVDTSPITPPPLVAPPDPIKQQRAVTEAAQTAAAIQRRRGQAQASAGGTLLTGPVGLPQPAPVARKTLLGS